MPAPKIQADYDGLSEIANKFSQESGQTEKLMNEIANLVGSLQDGGWIGLGANNFFQEMESLVNPGVGRLIKALEDASSASKRIADALQQAEDECSGYFR
jgi:WXG100 family type VII secretion target